MINNNDKKYVLDAIDNLKNHSHKLTEMLSSIQLLMVDNNNSRIKDESFENELDNLSQHINAINGSIDKIERGLE